MSRLETKKINSRILPQLIGSMFIDAWIVMLALGGLAHINSMPVLALNYWSCLLITVISIALIPRNMRTAEYLEKILEKS